MDGSFQKFVYVCLGSDRLLGRTNRCGLQAGGDVGDSFEREAPDGSRESKFAFSPPAVGQGIEGQAHAESMLTGISTAAQGMRVEPSRPNEHGLTVQDGVDFAFERHVSISEVFAHPEREVECPRFVIDESDFVDPYEMFEHFCRRERS